MQGGEMDDNANQSAFIAPTTAMDEEKLIYSLEKEVLKKQLHTRTQETIMTPVPDVNPLSTLVAGQTISLVTEGIQSIVADQFSACFETPKQTKWNWNLWLLIGWIIGVAFRTVILLPVRLAWVVIFALVFFTRLGIFFLLHLMTHDTPRLHARIRHIMVWCANCILSSWSGVITYHGMVPTRRPNQVYVANHSSLVDFVVLMAARPFSTVGQQQPGWIAGIMQVLKLMDCIWFNRMVAKDRQYVLQSMKDHVSDPTKAPLLIFPEGVCVNNQYTVQFKTGAFQLDAEVCPIAIKYNTTFSNVYWNSSRESFTKYCLKLWHGWAIVADVWFLDPMTIMPDETPEAFSVRVKEAISAKAKLKSTDWNGYLKYFRPSARFMARQQALLSTTIVDGIEQAAPALYDEMGIDETGRVDDSVIGSVMRKRR